MVEYYSKDYPYPEDNPLLLPQEIAFKVTNTSQNIDKEAPLLESVTIDKLSVEAPGTIGVTVKATDDISGIRRIYLSFINTKNGRTMTVSLKQTNETDIYLGNVKITQFEPDGEFYLDRVSLEDFAENMVEYYSKDYPYPGDNPLLLPQEIAFKVTNTSQNIDNEAPLLESVTIDKLSVEAPGTIGVTVKATDDISGIRRIYLSFINTKNGRTMTVSLKQTNEADIYSGNVEITQFEPDGEFYLDRVSLEDFAENMVEYYSKDYPYPGDNPLLLPQEIAFKVANGEDSTFTTNTTSSTLVSDIKRQPDTATVYINYKTGSNLTADVFEAIKDTNKTIILTRGAIGTGDA